MSVSSSSWCVISSVETRYAGPLHHGAIVLCSHWSQSLDDRLKGIPVSSMSEAIRDFHLSRNAVSSILCLPSILRLSGSMHAIPSMTGYHLPHFGQVINASSISSTSSPSASRLCEVKTSNSNSLLQSLTGQARMSINQRFISITSVAGVE
jgi:hypothetical protein